MCDQTIPIPQKNKAMHKAWLGWGLRFPSGPTYRVGVATICRACGLDVGGHQAHDMLIEFKDGFKIMRVVL